MRSLKYHLCLRNHRESFRPEKRTTPKQPTGIHWKAHRPIWESCENTRKGSAQFNSGGVQGIQVKIWEWSSLGPIKFQTWSSRAPLQDRAPREEKLGKLKLSKTETIKTKKRQAYITIEEKPETSKSKLSYFEHCTKREFYEVWKAILNYPPSKSPRKPVSLKMSKDSGLRSFCWKIKMSKEKKWCQNSYKVIRKTSSSKTTSLQTMKTCQKDLTT